MKPNPLRRLPRGLCLALLAVLFALTCVGTGPQAGVSSSRPQDNGAEEAPKADESNATPGADEGATGKQEKESIFRKYEKKFDGFFKTLNSYIKKVLFFDISGGAFKVQKKDKEGNLLTKEKTDVHGNPVLDASGNPIMEPDEGGEIPFILVILVLGSVFFTFWYGWINFRGFKHSINIIRGKFDKPEDKGEISHFRALTSALSATVGLGNIAGVSIAISLGGPGAVFWMMVIAVFGMTAKFSECTLSQLYRQHNPDGTISGGPMYYLSLGLKAKGEAWGVLGKVLAVLFAVACIGGALGGGNMFQSNQSFSALSQAFNLGDVAGYSWIYGAILSVLVGLVIIGGIKRIGYTTSRIVPTMCVIYVLASLVIIFLNIEKIPGVIGLIFSEAFTSNALYGGFVGVMIWGFIRAAFSNEAGLGSAAIAHAAAKTDEPVREGLVAMIGPFIDTIIICLMTSLVVIITGAYQVEGLSDVRITVHAFKETIVGSQYVLGVCIVLFAYSTMIAWCYYGERAWMYLFGRKSLLVFRIIFVCCVFLGAILNIENVLGFSDYIILCMAFPNIIGSVILAPYVRDKVRDYWGRYKSGAMKPVR